MGAKHSTNPKNKKIQENKKNEELKIKNDKVKNNIFLNSLTENEKILISKIPKLNKTYVCSCCKEIPLITIKNILNKFCFIKQCSKNKIIINEIDKLLNSSLKLIDITISKNKKFDLLPFESQGEFENFKKVAQSYFNIKDYILEMNNGDTKNNLVFSFFENLLSIGLYGTNTKFEYLNSVAIKEFKKEKFNFYNKIYRLHNGRKFYLKTTKELSLPKSELVVFCPGFYAIKSNYKVKIIKGSIEEIEISSKYNYGLKNVKIYDMEYKGFSGIIREITCLNKDKDIYLLRDNSILLAQFNGTIFDFKTLHPATDDYEIINIRELRKCIKKYSKNSDNSLQFMLIGRNIIKLCEYSNESGFSILIKINYGNKNNNIGYGIKCNSFVIKNKSTLISREYGIYLLDLYNFQINAFIELKYNINNYFIKINDYKVLYGGNAVINIKNFDIKFLSFGPNFSTSVCKIDNNLIFNSGDMLCFVDINTKKIFSIPHCLLNSNKIFHINDKEFGIFYEQSGIKDKYFIDIYTFIN